MFYLMVVLYFVLTCFFAWMFFFPSGRELISDVLASFGTKVEQKFSRLENSAIKKTVSTRYGVQRVMRQGVEFVIRHYVLFMLFICIVTVPPLIAIFMSGKSALDGFGSSDREINMQIAELLKGEQLVPPAPLPPAFFSTREVLTERPMLFSASRNWELLNNNYKQRLLMVFRVMKEKYGYEMAIIEGYRSPERQNMLAELGAQVTNAKAFQSYHQFGLAADCAFIRDGKLVISEKDAWAMRGYELYGEIAESAGLVWGGRWKMMDFGHTELRQPDVKKN